MTQLAPSLTSDELPLVNEIVRNVMILTAGDDPERRIVIAVQAIAQILGVTMAVESAPRRNLDSKRLCEQVSKKMVEAAEHAFIHAMAELVRKPGHDVEKILIDLHREHFDQIGGGQDQLPVMP